MKRLFLWIKPLIKQLFDRIRNEKVKQNLLQAIPFWSASLITGVIAVFYAKLFILAEHLTTAIINYNALLLFIITPVCFIFSWYLVKRFAPFAKGSGIPQVMAAVDLATPKHNQKISKLLSIRIILVKIISSIVMVIGGGAIGREGPTIQIAGSVFRKINESLPAWWPRTSKKNMIMTGAAAGLAAAFNTPLGGIVFAVEELTKMHISYFKAAIFTAVIIAGMTVQGFLGPYLYLGYPDVTITSHVLILAVALVAIVAGLFGSSMAKVMWRVINWKNKFKHDYQHIIFLLVCSVIIAGTAFLVSVDILGSGKDLITRVLFEDDKSIAWYTPILRYLGPVLSFTTGAAGGVFAPGLSGGAAVGAFMASILDLADSDANLLILAGMVAFLTGITRAPFTSAILVLEMTDHNNLILHLMLAGITANFVATAVDKQSLYDHLKQMYINESLDEEEELEMVDKP